MGANPEYQSGEQDGLIMLTGGVVMVPKLKEDVITNSTRQHQRGGEVDDNSISCVHDEGGTRLDTFSSPLSKSRSVANIKELFSNEEWKGVELSGGTSTLLRQNKNENIHTLKNEQQWYQKLQFFKPKNPETQPKILRPSLNIERK